MQRLRPLLCLALALAACQQRAPITPIGAPDGADDAFVADSAASDDLATDASSADPTTDPTQSDPVDDSTDVDVTPDSSAADTDLNEATEGDAIETDGPTDASAQPVAFTVGTWNLHNFSEYGTREFRIADIAAEITRMSPDVLAVQELKVAEGTSGDPPQAWDALLEALPDYSGIHAPWDTRDTTVGLIYRTDSVQITDSNTLFESDWSAFPRPPLSVSMTVGDADFTVLVLHLKAFGDSLDRRRDACQKLDAYIEARPGTEFVVIGDFNDSPYDDSHENAFTGTFLGDEYAFVTADLPEGSVTSTGFYHYVDGRRVTGEFLDHAVLTATLFDDFTSVEASIEGVDEPYDDYRHDLSDHFPVMVRFEP